MTGRSATVVQISDTHLSRRHAYFHRNWRLVVDEVGGMRPDLVVNTGDLSLNGADSDEDLAFAVAEHTRLPRPWLALPGNHDLGEEPGNLHLGQPVDERRLRRYRRLAGPDRWAVDVAEWRILGINSQLCGSGLPAEAEQLTWLERQVRRADRPVGLFLHKPLFVVDPGESAIDTACLLLEARWPLLRLIERSAVRFVACGHVHQARVDDWQGITMVWAPSTAFPSTGAGLRPGASSPLGWVVHRLHGAHHEVIVVNDDRLERHDLEALKGYGRYQFLYQTPPTPLSAESPGAEPGAPVEAGGLGAAAPS